MASMFGALQEQQAKDLRMSPAEIQRLSSVPSAMPAGYPTQQLSSFAAQASTNNQGYNSYPPQYNPQFQQMATAAHAYPQAQISHQNHSGGPSPVQVPYGGQQYFPAQNQQPYMYYQGQYGHLGGTQQSMQLNPRPYSSSYNRGPGFPYGQGSLPQPDGDLIAMSGKYPSYSGFVPSPSMPYGYHPSGPLLRPGSVPGKF